MQATRNILPEKKRTIAALLSFYALRPVYVVTIVLISLVALLAVWAILIDALAQLCNAIAQVWTESGAIEKLVILVLAWALLAWALRVYRRMHDAKL